MKLKIIIALASFCSLQALAVTWEEQSERLQKVSATLLDAVPFAFPVTHDFQISIDLPISFLPKTDPTIGGKSEKVPSSPVHAIPLVRLSSFVGRSNLFDLGIEAWGGYLMPGIEKFVGIDAKLSQFVYGAAISPSKQFNGFTGYLTIGGQISDATLTGAITATDANDKFSAYTSLIYFAPGFYSPSKQWWGNVLIGKKTTDSRFEIPADKTVFEITDDLSEEKLSYFIQATLGYQFTNGFRVGLAELWVPNRLIMPRLSMGMSLFER